MGMRSPGEWADYWDNDGGGGGAGEARCELCGRTFDNTHNLRTHRCPAAVPPT
jgi:hypothetical protein